jgi:hypothetical protein
MHSGTRGAIGELVELLAREQVSPHQCREIIARDGLEREVWFHKDQLDLVLGYIESVLEAGTLDKDRQNDIAALKDWLDIKEGEFAMYRPSEVAAILQRQLETILADWQVDEAEDVYQVALQTAFDLGYDQYLALTRVVLERAWAELLSLSDSKVDSHSSIVLQKRLAALEPLYRLAVAQPRTMGDLY